jgi:hypothetical protein
MNQRDVDAVGSCGVFQSLHVSASIFVGNLLSRILPLLTIFVLDLVDECVSAIRHEVLAGKLRKLGEVRVQSLEVSWVVIAKLTISSSREPQREASSVGFGVDIWTWPGDDIQTNTLGDLEELGEVTGAVLKVYGQVVRAVVGPVAVEGESREAL